LARREPLLFFSRADAETIEAVTARIFPSDDLGPGAREAGVTIYLDRALAGPYAHLADTYRQGVAGLNVASQRTAGVPFVALSEAEQDAILHDLEWGNLVEFGLAPAFMDLLIQHTREGMFCDPAHGGNRDLVGWKLMGYPGIHRVWTEEEEQIGVALPWRPMNTMADDTFGFAPPDAGEQP
jgi:gluconate 2-dehydrogenase gamma chain